MIRARLTVEASCAFSFFTSRVALPFFIVFALGTSNLAVLTLRSKVGARVSLTVLFFASRVDSEVTSTMRLPRKNFSTSLHSSLGIICSLFIFS